MTDQERARWVAGALNLAGAAVVVRAMGLEVSPRTLSPAATGEPRYRPDYVRYGLPTPDLHRQAEEIASEHAGAIRALARKILSTGRVAPGDVDAVLGEGAVDAP